MPGTAIGKPPPPPPPSPPQPRGTWVSGARCSSRPNRVSARPSWTPRTAPHPAPTCSSSPMILTSPRPSSVCAPSSAWPPHSSPSSPFSSTSSASATRSGPSSSMPSATASSPSCTSLASCWGTTPPALLPRSQPLWTRWWWARRVKAARCSSCSSTSSPSPGSCGGLYSPSLGSWLPGPSGAARPSRRKQ